MYARRASTYKAPPPSGGAPLPDHWWKLNVEPGDGQTYPDEGSLGTINIVEQGSGGSVLTVDPVYNFNGGRWTGSADQRPTTTGAGNHLRLQLESNPDFTGMTQISFAIRANQATGGTRPNDMRFFSQANATSEALHTLMFGLTSSTRVRVRIRDDDNSTDTYPFNYNITPGVDVHLAFVIDFTEPVATDRLKLYVDGSFEESLSIDGTQMGNPVSTQRTAVGAQQAGNPTNWTGLFAGYLADARLYLNKALNAQEVSDIYNNL